MRELVRFGDFIHGESASEALAQGLDAASGVRVQRVGVDATVSGPTSPSALSEGALDAAFMCCPSFFHVESLAREQGGPVPRPIACAVLDVPGVPGVGREATYSSRLVVRAADDRFSSLASLRGAVLAFNDDNSLSGVHALRIALRRGGLAGPAGKARPFFSRAMRCGSHAAAMRAVADGEADCAAIDCRVFHDETIRSPQLGSALLVLDEVELGPFPYPPLVAGAHVGDATAAHLLAALRKLPGPVLKALHIRTFIEPDYAAIVSLARELDDAKSLQLAGGTVDVASE